ncbi:MAG: c-type cytochrome [Gemmatimonas sp.]
MRSAILALGAVLAAAFAVRADAASDHVVAVYDTYCVQCHGVKRNGSGINVPALSVKPRDHTDAKGMGDLPDTEIFTAIKEGGLAVNKSALMPAWGEVLSDAEIGDLVKYLREVCKCGPSK